MIVYKLRSRMRSETFVPRVYEAGRDPVVACCFRCPPTRYLLLVALSNADPAYRLVLRTMVKRFKNSTLRDARR